MPRILLFGSFRHGRKGQGADDVRRLDHLHLGRGLFNDPVDRLLVARVDELDVGVVEEGFVAFNDVGTLGLVGVGLGPDRHTDAGDEHRLAQIGAMEIARVHRPRLDQVAAADENSVDFLDHVLDRTGEIRLFRHVGQRAKGEILSEIFFEDLKEKFVPVVAVTEKSTDSDDRLFTAGLKRHFCNPLLQHPVNGPCRLVSCKIPRRQPDLFGKSCHRNKTLKLFTAPLFAEESGRRSSLRCVANRFCPLPPQRIDRRVQCTQYRASPVISSQNATSSSMSPSGVSTHRNRLPMRYVKASKKSSLAHRRPYVRGRVYDHCVPFDTTIHLRILPRMEGLMAQLRA